MEASQAFIKFQKKQKNIKTKNTPDTIYRNTINKEYYMCISKLQYDWYSKFCPNLKNTTLRIELEK